MHIGEGRATVADHRPSLLVVTEATADVQERDLAREWLRWLFAQQRRRIGGKLETRVPLRRPMLEHLRTPPPLYWDGNREPRELAHVDIVACYHTLASMMSLDTWYIPGTAWGTGHYRWLGADEIRPYKLARNAAIGLARSTSFRFLEHGKARATPPQANRFLAPGMWGAMQDVLHCIAGEALRRGATHIHTDGYLLPPGEAGRFAAWVADRFHLECTVEISPTEVTSLGGMRSAAHTTETFGRSGLPIDSVRRECLALEGWLAKSLERSRKNIALGP